MDMSVIVPGGQWFSDRSGTGKIYRLIDAALEEKNREERMVAIVRLGESADPRAVRPLILCCGEKDAEIRRYAIEALGKIRSGRAIDVLVEHLDDGKEDLAIRISAITALAAIRSEHACQELRSRSLDPEQDPAIRSAIAEVLGRAQDR